MLLKYEPKCLKRGTLIILTMTPTMTPLRFPQTLLYILLFLTSFHYVISFKCVQYHRVTRPLINKYGSKHNIHTR